MKVKFTITNWNRTKDGRPVSRYAPSATGLDEEVAVVASLVVQCKRCGGEVGWVFEPPGPLSYGLPQIVVQRSFPNTDWYTDTSRPDRVSTAAPLDQGIVVSSFTTITTYCGDCRQDRTVHRRDIDAALRSGRPTIRVNARPSV